MYMNEIFGTVVEIVRACNITDGCQFLVYGTEEHEHVDQLK